MFKKILKFILYIVLLYGVVGFLVLPFVLKSQIVEIVQNETNSKISIESVYFNPFVFKLKISDIRLKSLEDKELLSLKSILINVEPHSLFKSALHLKDFILEEPAISLVLNADKSLNLSAILKEKTGSSKEEESTTELPRVILDRVAIVDGSLSYEDFTKETKFDFLFDRIGFELRDIDTYDYNSSDGTLRFYTTLGDGGFVDFKSELLGFEPFKVQGSLDFEASKLYSQWRYMQDSLNLEVADGKVAFHTDYFVNLDDLNATTLQNITLSLEKLRVKPKKKHKDVLNLESFYIQNATVKPMLQEIHVPKMGLDSLHIRVKRSANGKIDWSEYIKTTSPQKQVADKENKKEKEWQLVVDEVALQKIKVDFNDYKVKPNVATNLHELNIYMQNVTLAGVEDLKYQMDMRLNTALKCSSKGQVKHKVLDVDSNFKCSGLDLLHYRPYIDEVAHDALQVYNLSLVRGVVGFDGKVNVKEEGSQKNINLSDVNLNLNKFALNKRSSGERLVTFSDFNIKGMSLDTKSKEILIRKSNLDGVSVRSAMSKKSHLNFDNLVVVKKAKKSLKSKKPQKESKEYHLLLKHFALNGARAYFLDRRLSPKVESKFGRMSLNLYNIDSKKKTWLKYNFSARVNDKGYIKSNGSLRHTPLRNLSSVRVDRISLKELTPYIKESAYVSIDDGYLSAKTKIKYAQSSKRPDLSVEGSVKLEEFFTSDTRDNSSIFSINTLKVRSFTYEMAPDRLFVDEINADAFFVNAVVDKNKTINFAKLVKVKTKESNTSKEVVAKEEVKSEPLPMTIAKVYVSGGSAFFADYSLPINFETNIHDLNGVVYGISNTKGELTQVDIAGAIDEYGSTKLKGSLNSENPKAFLDLDFNFKNLDLSNMSGYSASFAGYEIDKGKLYLDLGYKIKNSELLGKNSIIVKNIELGDEIEGADTLPLGFVIALLEDGDGVIDIDMPIAGNVDEPDFKYGALVWKTMGNLILKAVTSPFRFLGSMMGMDGDSLEYAEFEAGSLNILPPEREKLDSVAKMFIKRPKISLSVAGIYDEVSDKEALQKEKLITLVVKESGIKNRKDHKTAMTVDLLENIYEDIKDDDKLQKIEDALEKRYKDDEFDSKYLNAVVAECIKIQPIVPKELEDLALHRAYAIKDYLVSEKGIVASRVKILDIAKVDKKDEVLVKTKLEVVVK